MRAIIIDSLIGNDYTINLCKALRGNVKDLTLIVPKNRAVELSSGIKIKYWAPSKDSKINKLRKILDYAIYLLRMLFFIMSKTDSTRLAHLALGRSSRLWTESVRWALVIVIDRIS